MFSMRFSLFVVLMILIVILTSYILPYLQKYQKICELINQNPFKSFFCYQYVPHLSSSLHFEVFENYRFFLDFAVFSKAQDSNNTICVVYTQKNCKIESSPIRSFRVNTNTMIKYKWDRRCCNSGSTLFITGAKEHSSLVSTLSMRAFCVRNSQFQLLLKTKSAEAWTVRALFTTYFLSSWLLREKLRFLPDWCDDTHAWFYKYSKLQNERNQFSFVSLSYQLCIFLIHFHCII